MNPILLDSLPHTFREAILSGGYRVWRWLEARRVLQSRLVKGRLGEELGGFLTPWLAEASIPDSKDEIDLIFIGAQDQFWMTSASDVFVGVPLECALLHLPALRSFWRQELRSAHFEALQTSIPPAWLLADTTVPAGAVIHGLGIRSWQDLDLNKRRDLVIAGEEGESTMDLTAALAAGNKILMMPPAGEARLHASYKCDDKGRIVLRSLEASP